MCYVLPIENATTKRGRKKRGRKKESYQIHLINFISKCPFDERGILLVQRKILRIRLKIAGRKTILRMEVKDLRLIVLRIFKNVPPALDMFDIGGAIIQELYICRNFYEKSHANCIEERVIFI